MRRWSLAWDRRSTPMLGHVRACIYTSLARGKHKAMEARLLAESKEVIEMAARAVEFAAALIISLAALEATVKAFILFFKRGATPEQKNGVRLTLARWLALALEFELAADILNTAVTPTWTDIEKLAAIATLRTALNYFLERELQQEAEPAQKQAERITTGKDTSVMGSR